MPETNPCVITFFSCLKFAWMKPLALGRLKKTWPDCPYPVNWVSDDTGRGWSVTFLQYAEEHKGERTLILMDDYMVDRIDTKRLHQAFSMTEVACVRMTPCPGPTLPYPVEGFGLIDKSQPYAVSLQPAVWYLGDLASLIDPSWNPWEVEMLGSQRAFNCSRPFIGTLDRAVDYYDLSRKGDIVGGNLRRVKEELGLA